MSVSSENNIKAVKHDQVSIIQPFIPHYREDFFIALSKKISYDLFCVQKPRSNESFTKSDKIDYIWLK